MCCRGRGRGGACLKLSEAPATADAKRSSNEDVRSLVELLKLRLVEEKENEAAADVGGELGAADGSGEAVGGGGGMSARGRRGWPRYRELCGGGTRYVGGASRVLRMAEKESLQSPAMLEPNSNRPDPTSFQRSSRSRWVMSCSCCVRGVDADTSSRGDL